MNRQATSPRAVWLAMIMMAAVLAAACASGLFWIAGAGAIAAMSAGGTTFLGVASIGIAVLSVLSAG